MLGKTLSKAIAVSATCLGFLAAPAGAQQFYLGEIIIGGWNFCPRGTSTAAGQILAISSNQSLFSLYGCTYGGDCRTSFALPDLRGRSPVSVGHGAGLSNYQLGQKSGTETNTMTVAQMPSHSHGVTSTAVSTLGGSGRGAAVSGGNGKPLSTNATAFSDNPINQNLDPGSVTTTVTTTINNNGGGRAQNNLSPYLALQYCVVMQGTFPSRN